MDTVLLAAIATMQVVILGCLWVGTNLAIRLWQIPLIGKFLDRRPGRNAWKEDY